MSANFVFQPKPEGDRYVQVHISYKRITDGKESTAALLSVLEYLAKQSLLNSGTWSIGDPLPQSIVIQGDCNYPRLNRLLDGWLKPTALRSKLQDLAHLGFISLDTTTNHRRRYVTYHYGAIALALAHVELHPSSGDASNNAPSKNDSSKNDPSESGASSTQNQGNETASVNEPSRKCGLTLQKVETIPSKNGTSGVISPQKVDPSRSPDPLAVQKADRLPHSSRSSQSAPPRQPLPSGPNESIAQADFELLSAVQQQAYRLRGGAIALDPWISEAASNPVNVLRGRAFRCQFDDGFSHYLWQQLRRSPYWQQRPDDPPTNAGIRILKSLYAIAEPAAREAERERLRGEWDKYQALQTRQAEIASLRHQACSSNEPAVHRLSSSTDDYVPFSELPQAVQGLFSRFRRIPAAPTGQSVCHVG